MVRKASGFEIFNHWALALSCILLAITGFGFLFKVEGIFSFFGGGQSMKTIHNYLGVVFSAALFLSIFNWLKEAMTFDADDITWIKMAGGYLSKKAKTPPMGKINTGQKFYYLAILVFGIAISISGNIVWLTSGERSAILLSHLVHNIAFDLIVMAVPVHVYLATLANPGTLRIMITGTVPLEWAKKKHPKWVAELESHK
jgi:formate dehydrogenase subunit gamma